jgi:hypothetical protein
MIIQFLFIISGFKDSIFNIQDSKFKDWQLATGYWPLADTPAFQEIAEP